MTEKQAKTGNSQATILFPVSVGIAARRNSVPYLKLGAFATAVSEGNVK
jgi:hypothetical protein